MGGSFLSMGSAGRARRLLLGYDDEPFLHSGAPGALSRERREVNLAGFLSSLDRRVSRIRAFAGVLGVELPEADGDRGRVDTVAQSIDAFCKEKLSGLAEIERALAHDWRSQAPMGPDRRMQTLVIDLAAYCGNIGLRCAPKYRWVTDETRYTPATLMKTAGRIVIGYDPAVVTDRMSNHVDLVDITAFSLSQIVRHRRAKSLWRPCYFTFLSSLADGLYA